MNLEETQEMLASNKLWLLRPHKTHVKFDEYGAEPMHAIRSGNLWDPWYDKVFGFVVCAPTEETARAIASENAGGETRYAWLYPEHSTCTEMRPAKTGMIMRDLWSA